MKKITLTLAVLLAVSGLSACSKEKSEGSATVTTTTTTTPAGTESKTVVAEKAGSITGVAECDVFITKYEQCINNKVPEAARSMVKSTLDQQRQAWIQAAATPEGKQGLALACGTALSSAKQAMSMYGCEW